MTFIRLTLTPTQNLLFLRVDAPGSTLPKSIAQALEKDFAHSTGTGLLRFAGLVPTAPLADNEAFWRDFAKDYLSRELTGSSAAANLTSLALSRQRLTTEDLKRWITRAPPIHGGEYLNESSLQHIANLLIAAVRECKEQNTQSSLREILVTMNPSWDILGRVCFSLAENKNVPSRPFAMLATYTTQLNNEAKPRHAPLARALKEQALRGGDSQLERIIGVLRHAASASEQIKEWLESRQIFQPLALTIKEAHQFLKDIPQLEKAGVMIRVPDWWSRSKPPRPRVTVTIEEKETGGAGRVGANALLSFKVEFSLFGQKLSAAQWQQLRSEASGLVFLRGHWVEVDAHKIEQALEAWRKSEALVAQSGLSFTQAMRLLVGGGPRSGKDQAASSTEDDEVRNWSDVVAGPWLKKILTELKNPENAAPPNLGKSFKATLRPYQKAGLSWLWRLKMLGLGGCLADDMGLGKTIQVLAYLSTLKKESITPSKNEPHLIIAPATLIANWQTEAAKFSPLLKVLVAHPSQISANALSSRPANLNSYDLVITSYGALLRYAWITTESWNVAVLDEAQAIKNPETQQTKATKKLITKQRLALTGTPIENRPLDLWSIFDFINPGLLGTSKQFSDFMADTSSKSPFPTIRSLVAPYILRRLKTDKTLLPDLPAKTELVVNCGLMPRQAVLYERVVSELKEDLTQAAKKEGIQRKGIVLSALLKLKQVCNHPALATGHGDFLLEESGKLKRLTELADEIASRQERLLVFTQFKEMTTVLDKILEDIFKRPGCVLHGSTPLKQRRLLVDQFQKPEGPPYFVLSLKAGGTGLTLTAASHVIHFDRWWNPAVEDQATDRAHRIGQKKNVLVHKLTCGGTVEAKIADLITRKRQLAGQLLTDKLGNSDLLLTELNDEELLALVSLDLSKACCEA